MRLQDQTAIVTGAGRGIGRATALALAREGASLTLAARTRVEIEAVAAEILALGPEALAIPTDVAVKAAVQAMVAQTIDRFGKVDILVNNAGVAGTSPIPNITEELWDRNIAVNLKALFLCTQAVFSHMYGPRQTGKTSALLALRDLLNSGAAGDYRCVYVNVEAAQAVREDVGRAMRVIVGRLASRARFWATGFCTRPGATSLPTSATAPWRRP